MGEVETGTSPSSPPPRSSPSLRCLVRLPSSTCHTALHYLFPCLSLPPHCELLHRVGSCLTHHLASPGPSTGPGTRQLLPSMSKTEFN